MRTRLAIVLLVVALVWPAVMTSAPAAAPSTARWVAAFAAPAQGGVPHPQALSAPSSASVRSIARLSTGGSRVRIRLSNAASAGPALRIAGATLGKQRAPGSPALVPGSVRRVTFGGSKTVTLRPGTARAYSDAVDMRVAAGDNLAITLHLPATENPDAAAATWSTGFRTDAGHADATTNEDGAPFTTPFNGAYALTGLDVFTGDATGSIVGWGSSTFEGWGSTRDGYDRVLDVVAGRVSATVPRGRRLSVVSAGIGGDATTAGIARLERDVFSHTAVRAVILYNINDTGAQYRRTADQVLADYATIIRAAHRRGIRVYCPTWGPGAQQLGAQERYLLNERLLKDRPCDGVVDWASVLATVPHGRGYTPLYDIYQAQYIADGIHPNPNGHAALAAAAPISWFSAGAAR